MSRSSDRLGIQENEQGNAHSFGLIAPQVSAAVAKWRTEASEQWGENERNIDSARLARAFEKAERLGLDAYFVAYLTMGAEWLFRVRKLTEADIHGALDKLESRLRRQGLGDVTSWQASLVVAAVHDRAHDLKGRRYLLSLGQWAFRIESWRDLVQGTKRKGKPGKLTTLSPIVVGLVIDRIAETKCAPGKGGKALALELSSILRGREVQTGDLGLWRRCAATPASGPDERGSDHDSRADLCAQLVQLWESAYDSCFRQQVSSVPGRDWPAFMIEAMTNPLTLFAPAADGEVVARLYDMAWWYDDAPVRRASKQ